MTAPDEEPNPASGGEPHLRIRRSDGSWEELVPKPGNDDPEVAAIGNLSFGDVRGILKDPDDPRYEAAQEYTRVLNARLAERFAPTFKKVSESLASVTERLPNLPFRDDQENRNLERFRKSVKPVEVPDISSFELRNPALDVVREQQELNQRMAESNALLSAMLDQSQTATEGERRALADQKKHSRLALVAAWVAVAVSVIVGLIQIIWR